MRFLVVGWIGLDERDSVFPIVAQTRRYYSEHDGVRTIAPSHIDVKPYGPTSQVCSDGKSSRERVSIEVGGWLTIHGIARNTTSGSRDHPRKEACTYVSQPGGFAVENKSAWDSHLHR